MRLPGSTSITPSSSALEFAGLLSEKADRNVASRNV